MNRNITNIVSALVLAYVTGCNTSSSHTEIIDESSSPSGSGATDNAGSGGNVAGNVTGSGSMPSSDTGGVAGTGASDANGTGSSTSSGSGSNQGAGGNTGSGGDGTGDAGTSVVSIADAGCPDEDLLPLPEDPGVRGPWKVGIKTVQIGRLETDVIYPAEPGSTDGVEVATFDIRDWLPEAERSKVPDDAVPAVTAIDGDLYRDVPIDGGHGPYPLIVMIHGTASMRIAAGSTLAHWASRGFVIASADYPGLGLSDKLSETLECSLPVSGAQDLPGDVTLQMNAMKNPTGDLAFLAGHVNTDRAGLGGHSQGGCVVATLPGMFSNVEVVIAESASSYMTAASNLKAYMYIGGISDTVINFAPPAVTLGNIVCPANPLPASTQTEAYNLSVGPPDTRKRLVGITGGGHLLPTDLCQKNQYDRNAIEEAQMDGVCGISSAVIIGLPTLFDCGTIDWIEGLRAVNYATTAQLEETLHCMDRSQAFQDMQSKYPSIGTFEESL